MKNEYKYKITRIGNKTKIYLNHKKFSKNGELKEEKDKLIGGFTYIKEIKGPVLDWKGNNLNNQKQIEIEIFDFHKEDKVKKKVFEWDSFNSQQLYNFIKIQGAPNLSDVDDMMEMFFDQEIFSNKNKVVEKCEKKFSEILGINAKGDLILPTEYEVLNKELYEDDRDYKSFINIFKEQDISKEELEEIVDYLYRYVSNDDYSKIIFAYGFASIFRLYLMEEYGLRLFPYLMMISQSPNRGKSTTAKLLINSIFLGYDINVSESSKITMGSVKRLIEKQYGSIPLFIDEFAGFGDNEEVYKEFATQSIYDTNLGYGNRIKNYNLVLRRGGLVSSTNKLAKEIPDALRDRYLLSNFENRKGYVGVDDDVTYLAKNLHKISKFIWTNMLDFKQSINIKSNDRTNAKVEVLNVGMQLVNSFFLRFNKDVLELDTNGIVKSEEHLIATDNDRIKSILYKEIRTITRRPTGSNIYSIPQLAINISNSQKWVNIYETNYREEFGSLNGAYNDHYAQTNRNILRTLELDYRRIIDDSIQYGLYINDDGIIMTKKFLDHLKTSYPNEFTSTPTLPNLMTIFSKDEIEYASSSNKATIPVIKKVYGIDELSMNISYNIVTAQVSGLLWKKGLDNEDIDEED